MIYIIIVSHGHDKFVDSLLNSLNTCSKRYKIIVRDNKGSSELKHICEAYANLDYLNGGVYGFGHNNNIAVSHVVKKYGVKDEDYFLFLNPDISIDDNTLVNYFEYVMQRKYKFSTLCLYRDFQKRVHDYSVRDFPSFYDFCCSFLGSGNKTKVNKDAVIDDLVVDWCAGSFMFINAFSFLNVNGFDQNYFMYCEDIDLCYRLNLSGVPLNYVPHFEAIHYAHHDNRNFFSKAFRWHVKSIFRYLSRKAILSRRNYKRINSLLRTV